ncbi:MAG: UDP-N-acetylglucosamine 2-epimerase (non-hydrolyzing) [Cyclobacteriaceae bacterium]|nr:UDP-N-acetylglucosamine 2-epimerase (non-hydrolyzing) [Cyclobacteriaceae bacterium]UYN85585.1 MAG: UDP-N-acetylglucosamine 2-epimerase (non-hydrolyzing) [Cyclobacteriaceae bacterium]
MIKILTVLGARPQFIKAAALSRIFQQRPIFQEVIVHTGQHFDQNMSDIFFQELSIPKPVYNLNINGLSHGAMTGQMLAGVEEIIQKEKPDYALVYGDTNSTLAGALAAKKLKVSVVHVEAGLRSFNMEMPEEINRILTDRISDVLCCPTDAAIRNLESEGFGNFGVVITKTGDVMQDAADFYAAKVNSDEICKQFGLTPGNFVLCTLHRAENTDDPKRLQAIITALQQIGKHAQVVMPVHPRTRSRLEKTSMGGITCLDPQSYLTMIGLLKSCAMVMTDSGGLQKEAYFFKKYCVTLRTETEWVELVEQGVNRIVGFDRDAILSGFAEFSGKPWKTNAELYGGGKASEAICSVIEEHSKQKIQKF